jgi:hypothetical protein
LLASLAFSTFPAMASVEFHVDAEMASLAHVFQVREVAAERVTFAEMRRGEHDQSARP